jgi:hypothetical protein
MSFIQIIEYETDRPDEIRALGEAQWGKLPSTRDGFRLAMTNDRDHPNRYVTIVEFPSYEAAMANSRRPETNEYANRMAALCTKGPEYRNLDVRMAAP